MKCLLILFFLIPHIVLAKIEDNSFLLEEAFNQDWGAYQFIQKYQTFEASKTYQYSFENEIPITDKKHQFSYEIPYQRAQDIEHGAIGDITLNYRWQPLNRDGFMLADRFGLIFPTGRVEKGSGAGVYGFEFMQAATMTVSDDFMAHWNFGFSILPHAKTDSTSKRRTLTSITTGASFVYLMKDDFNIMLEGLLESGQGLAEDGTKVNETSFTINPGLRYALDLVWKDMQIVPGISFPVELLNAPTEHGVFVYLSFELKFY